MELKNGRQECLPHEQVCLPHQDADLCPQRIGAVIENSGPDIPVWRLRRSGLTDIATAGIACNE